jgi:hypothetical protein
LKRKTSRFGLGQLITGNNSSNQTAVATSQVSHSQNYSFIHPHLQSHHIHQNYLQVNFPQKTPVSPHHIAANSQPPQQPSHPSCNQIHSNNTTTPQTPTIAMSDNVQQQQVFFFQQPQLQQQTFHSGNGVSGK